MNPLCELQGFGQSVWMDQIRRDMLLSGELRRLIDEDCITGLTSNPTIFQKAITGSDTYDEQIARLARAGLSVQQIFEALAIEDLQQAADLFRPIYDRTGGVDGYISMEVTPDLAYDTQGTIEQARRYHAALGRPNVLIKIPATAEGLVAIEQCIADGININVTLLFSLERYRQVMQAYIAGLERRVSAGLPVEQIHSVASFFVSRVDTSADKLFGERIAKGGAEVEQATALQGRVAVANARLAYQEFLAVFEGERFARLRELGAHVQRPLWASTSTKNPSYSDTLYVETLIGPSTVNTMPMETIAAFREHGRAAETLGAEVEQDRALFRQLRELGISIEAITARLERDGVKSFADSYNQLLAGIGEKRARLGALETPAVSASLASLAGELAELLPQLHDEGVARRLWQADPSLWKSEPDHQRIIRGRLGWLNSPTQMLSQVAGLERFGREIRAAGFRHVLLLGMGGSSLAPEVLQATIGNAPGFPALTVLDTTVPEAIRSIEDRLGYGNTLFVVASKSGGTVETAALDAYFYGQACKLLGQHAGQHFIAITDPGSWLEQSANERGFRRVFLNDPNIGGRYSALSLFGLVPAALIGLDVLTLLERAGVMARRCSPEVAVEENPGLWLGALLGLAASRGSDKLTLLSSPSFNSFGYWLEQLIAESTGKDWRGIVPIEGEPVGEPSVYGEDRVFVYLRVDGDAADETDAQVAGLEQAGLPVVRIRLRDGYDLGAEIFRWEFATAVAAAILGVNPFDEPNVLESKSNTKRLLEQFRQDGSLPDQPEGDEQRFGENAAELLRRFFKRVQPGDYIALQAYLEPRPAYAALLQAIRLQLRDRLRVATTLGYGPRFLHSTGQLHKGGSKNGVYLQISADDVDDLTIPGQPYSFSLLKTAQALGDLEALQSRSRRVMNLDVGRLPEQGLQELLTALEEAFK